MERGAEARVPASQAGPRAAPGIESDGNTTVLRGARWTGTG
jgi:hypothetical protein